MNIKNEIKQAFVENKKAIYAAFAILLVSLILGYVLEPYLYSIFNPFVETLTEKVKTGVIKVTFADIFLNNFRIIVLMFIFGILFCISGLILAFNGFFIGYYVGTSDDLLTVLLLIIPHGIFELPSCALACASSFVLFNFAVKFVNALFEQKDGSFTEKLKGAGDESFDKLKQAVTLFAISLVLMVIAGIFEVYLTIPIAKFILSVLG